MGARGQGGAHTEQTASFSNPVGNLLRPPLRPGGEAGLEPYSGRRRVKTAVGGFIYSGRRKEALLRPEEALLRPEERLTPAGVGLYYGRSSGFTAGLGPVRPPERLTPARREGSYGSKRACSGPTGFCVTTGF